MAHTKKDSSSSSSRSGCLLFLILTTVLIFLIVSALLTYISGLPEDDPILYKRTVRAVLDSFPVDVTPDDWVWVIWPLTWLYLFMWMVYGVSLLCRKPGDGKGMLYSRPPFIPMGVYASFSLSLLALAGWTVLWTEEMLRWAALAMLGVVIFAVAAMILAIRALHFYADDLYRLGNGQDVIFDRLVVQNALGMFSAWVVFAGILNLTMALVYEWDMDQIDASTVALSSMGGIIIIYFIVDILVVEKDTRYILTPYIVFTVVMSAILVKEFDGGDRNFLVALFLVGLSGFTTLFKLASMISHARKGEHHDCEDKKGLLSDHSDDDDDDDDDDDIHVNDEETAKYIKQAQLLLSAK